jgi:branched-chain amino acid transport system permease protein
VSETIRERSGADVATGASGSGAHRLTGAEHRRGISPSMIALAVVLVLLLLVPFFIEEFWLNVGFAAFGAIIGAIGLNLLVGTAGQLSLAHGAFLAVGAITYTYFSGEPEAGVATDVKGLELSPVIGMVLGVIFAGIAGLLFSPIAARLRGIYLGVASIALTFIAVYVLNNLTSVTGGVNGRAVPDFDLFGFSFTDSDPNLFVANVEFDRYEKLWYLGLALAVGAYVVASNLIRSRPGRALQTLRDSETAAAVMGVNVQRYKATAFFVSSMFAGLAGVMYALSLRSIAPESFTFELSVLYLAMIVIGGLGSVLGATLGAVFVSALPLVLDEYSDSIPFIGEGGGSGFNATEVARFIYGGLILAVIMFEPRGLIGLVQRLKPARRPPGGQSQPGLAPGSTGDTATTTTPPSNRPPST